MVCPQCKSQYDIYNAVVEDEGENEGLWICPDCRCPLDESDAQSNEFDPTIESAG